MIKSVASVGDKTFRRVLFAALLIADRAAKFLVELYLPESSVRESARFLSLSVHYNRGISFSLLENYPAAGLIASISGAAALGFACFKDARLRSTFGVLFLWAGAIGNLIDRLLYGYVIDWLYVGIYVNFADIWLCMGCVMIFSHYVFFDNERNR